MSGEYWYMHRLMVHTHTHTSYTYLIKLKRCFTAAILITLTENV